MVIYVRGAQAAGNAAYWYQQAGQPVASDSMESEWTRIAEALLA